LAGFDKPKLSSQNYSSGRQTYAIHNTNSSVVVLDPVGGPTTESVLKVLAMNGRALFYGLISGLPEIKVNYYNVLMQNQKLEGFRITPWLLKHSQEQIGKIFGDLITLLASKQILPLLEDVLPLEEFKNAVIKSVTPGKLGKVFLAPHPEQVSRH
jgi:NADPH:quinone reductase-like Zn-dependent oxidoreductase